LLCIAILLPGDSGVVQYRYCIFSGGKFKGFEGDGSILRTINDDRDRTHVATTDVYEVPPEVCILPDNSAPLETAISQAEAQSFRSKQFEEWSKKAKNDINLSPQDGVVIVSYVLPVFLSKSATGRWTAVWDSENILALSLNMRVTWVGSVRYAGQPIPPEEEEMVARLLLDMNCYPVFINQRMHHQFYDVFCKQHMWPVMHHVADVYGPLNQTDIGAKGQQDLWFTYSTVNRLFRDKIVEVFQTGDLVWIQGFHLMLLPTFLRRTLPHAKVGYFFHTPFPSSEIWRSITRREDLIRGILGADHIGFHLYEYARHFRSVCHRILGYTSEVNPAGTLCVNVDGREVAITCIHVGVDLPRLQVILSADAFENDVRAWRAKFGKKIVVAGIDRLERLKAIPLKLNAIDQFMTESPHYKGKLLFAIVGISAMERGDDYKQTQHDVTQLVAKLNAKHGYVDDPIVMFEEHNERGMRLPQRTAFFAASDILLTLAARDGLNRFPMEFTLAKQRAAQLHYPADGPGPCDGMFSNLGLLIVSEFISSARVMRGALTVNPWRVEEVTGALKLALEMPESELVDRNRRNLEFSTRLTTERWAQHVLVDLKAVDKSYNPHDNLAIGFGLQYRVMGVRADFHPLNETSVAREYWASRCRLILLDWGGTLVADTDKSDAIHAYALAQGHASLSGPSPELTAALETLCSDVRNVVFVVSGKEMKSVQEYFGDVRGLGLAAEHGFYYRWPQDFTASSGRTRARWHTIQELGDQSWKHAARNVMDIYVQRTYGTYIETKGNSLIWQFRDADPEFGLMQSKELETHLNDVMEPHSIDVIRGGGINDGYIEVRPQGVSKGLFLQHALSKLKKYHRNVDFLMAIGDDSSDEPMFTQIASLLASTPKGEITAHSVSVGKKPTAAQCYVDDSSSVLELLVALNRTSQWDHFRGDDEGSRKFFSVVDLPSYGNRFKKVCCMFTA
jgi:trehalose 6-phosphate synthase/phosphatase